MENVRLVLTKKEEISRRLWEKFESESLFAQYSPFFISLASGTLALQAFYDFIPQDLHLLRAFYHAYLSVEKCLNEDAEKWVVRDLRENLRKEIVAYVKIIQEDLKLPKRETTYATIVNYRDFLHDTKSGKVEGRKVSCKRKVAAYTLCAIVPCMRLYSHLFQQMKKILHPSDTTAHNYKKCIDIYCSEDFEVLVTRTQFMLEKLSDCFTEDEVEVMEKHYHRALKLQVEFFFKLPTYKHALVALSRLQELRKNELTIFCAYDMTCPIVGSTSAAILANMSTALPQVYRMSSEELRNAWDVLDYQRTMDFEQWFEKIMSSTMPGRQVFNDTGLRKALLQVAECEIRASTKVVRSGTLTGISLDPIKSAASTVILQDGCRSFFQKLAENEGRNISVHIISNYWCSDLIKAVLSPEKNVFTIHSNELAVMNGATVGDITRIVETSSDNFKTFHAVMKGCKTEIGHLTVYIGGDVADLLCLLAADIGIVICPSLNLRRLADRFGLKFVALFDELIRRRNEPSADYYDDWKPYSGVLYTVSCWAEIEAFILGL